MRGRPCRLDSSDAKGAALGSAVTFGCGVLAAGAGAAGVVPTSRPRLARHVRLHFDRTRGRHVLLEPETVVEYRKKVNIK